MFPFARWPWLCRSTGLKPLPVLGKFPFSSSPWKFAYLNGLGTRMDKGEVPVWRNYRPNGRVPV